MTKQQKTDISEIKALCKENLRFELPSLDEDARLEARQNKVILLCQGLGKQLFTQELLIKENWKTKGWNWKLLNSFYI